jgi:hypothetical protein
MSQLTEVRSQPRGRPRTSFHPLVTPSSLGRIAEGVSKLAFNPPAPNLGGRIKLGDTPKAPAGASPRTPFE